MIDDKDEHTLFRRAHKIEELEETLNIFSGYCNFKDNARTVIDDNAEFMPDYLYVRDDKTQWKFKTSTVMNMCVIRR